MYTLSELLRRIEEAPLTNEKSAPNWKFLRKYGGGVVARAEFSGDAFIEVFANGYAFYYNGFRWTTFSMQDTTLSYEFNVQEDNPAHKERTVCRTEEVRIPGPHNLENALGAVCCAGIMEVPVPVIRHTLKTFRGVEHRIESVRVLDGVEYFNDSKGTNVDSTLKAIETMTRPTVLILGGYDKHVSFDPLSREIQERKDIIRETVLIGETAGQIEESLLRAGYDHIQHAETLREAVVLCRQTAEEGWNVLLSPACASFDMFKDYEERGRIFKKIVAEL